MFDKLNAVRNSLKCGNGLWYASTGKKYRYAWLRDIYHVARIDLKINPKAYKQTYRTILDYFLKIEKDYQKISWLIRDPYDKSDHRYIHPRFNVDLTEIDEPWGYKQWDAIFMVLKGMIEGIKNGIKIFRTPEDIDIVNKIIEAAYKLECWKDPESGAWENEKALRLSTLGVILSSLRDLKEYFFIPQDFITKTLAAFYTLFPNETSYREYDLAQLFIIYPFDVLKDPELEALILHRIEKNLLRETGVIRYIGDWYYNRANWYDMNRFGFKEMYIVDEYEGNEAPWHKGFIYLGLGYLHLGNIEKAQYYLTKSLKGHEDGRMRELSFAHTNIPNDNYPLAWTGSAAMELIYNIKEFNKNNSNRKLYQSQHHYDIKKLIL